MARRWRRRTAVFVIILSLACPVVAPADEPRPSGEIRLWEDHLGDGVLAGVTALVEVARGPAISEDGRLLAFSESAAAEDGDAEIYIRAEVRSGHTGRVVHRRVLANLETAIGDPQAASAVGARLDAPLRRMRAILKRHRWSPLERAPSIVDVDDPRVNEWRVPFGDLHVTVRDLGARLRVVMRSGTRVMATRSIRDQSESCGADSFLHAAYADPQRRVLLLRVFAVGVADGTVCGGDDIYVIPLPRSARQVQSPMDGS